jgi:threonine dehydratase
MCHQRLFLKKCHKNENISMNTVTFKDIINARERIGSGLYYSPCPPSEPLSELTGCQIFCKLDYLQRTGSFKERGARNVLLLLPEAQKRQGVIAASAGNHAQGLAYHGGLLEIPVTVIMPRFAPLIKVAACRRLGAEVILHGETFQEALSLAQEMAEDRGLTFIPAFDDPHVIAGQGTMALEIAEQVPELDAVIVPIGGGGLLAGIALALKHLTPHVKIYGVEPARAAPFVAALDVGHPIRISIGPTVADGLAVSEVGALSFALAAPLVEKVVTVSEDEIALSMLRIAEMEKGVVEGAGAAPLAALLAGKLPELWGKTVVLPLCGGNVDPLIFCRVIEQGMVADGRLSRLTALIKDRPGALAEFTGLVAAVGAGIREITHERAFAGPDVSEVHVLCIVETRDHAHIKTLHDVLRAEGVRFIIPPRILEDAI